MLPSSFVSDYFPLDVDLAVELLDLDTRFVKSLGRIKDDDLYREMLKQLVAKFGKVPYQDVEMSSQKTLTHTVSVPTFYQGKPMRFWKIIYSGITTEELIEAIKDRKVYGLNEEDRVVSSSEQINLGEDLEMSITPREWALRRDNNELADLIKEYADLEKRGFIFYGKKEPESSEEEESEFLEEKEAKSHRFFREFIKVG